VTDETMVAYNSGGSNMMDWSMDGVVGHRVSHSGSVVGGGGWVVLGVLGGSVIGNISNIAVIIVDMVIDVLDPPIGKSNGVGALSVTSSVRRLSSIEISLGVVI